MAIPTEQAAVTPDKRSMPTAAPAVVKQEMTETPEKKVPTLRIKLPSPSKTSEATNDGRESDGNASWYIYVYLAISEMRLQQESMYQYYIKLLRWVYL